MNYIQFITNLKKDKLINNLKFIFIYFYLILIKILLILFIKYYFLLIIILFHSFSIIIHKAQLFIQENKELFNYKYNDLLFHNN